MRKIVSILLSTMFVLALGITVSAQRTPSVDRREHRQQRRVHRGVKSGSLTRREAARMQAQQALCYFAARCCAWFCRSGRHSDLRQQLVTAETSLLNYPRCANVERSAFFM